MQEIKFSYNWNNKLDNKFFTSIRLHRPSRFFKGSNLVLSIKEGKEFKKTNIVEVIDLKLIKFSEISDWLFMIDTGYSAEEARQIFYNMYKKKVENVSDALFDLILLKKIREIK